jgi:hypothetical protein
MGKTKHLRPSNLEGQSMPHDKAAEQVPTADAVAAAVEAAPGLLRITLPIGPMPGVGHVTNHIEVRLLSLAQRLAFRRFWRGLDAAGHRLANGKRINRPPDAIRWLLEQIAAAADCSAISEASGAAAEKSAPD